MTLLILTKNQRRIKILKRFRNGSQSLEPNSAQALNWLATIRRCDLQSSCRLAHVGFHDLRRDYASEHRSSEGTVSFSKLRIEPLFFGCNRGYLGVHR